MCLQAKNNNIPGYYLLSEPSESGSAILESEPIIPGGVERCAVFYYHMYGASVGKFNVYKKVLLLECIITVYGFIS